MNVGGEVQTRLKAEHVNAFIQGAQNTFSTFCGENASLGKVFLKTAPYKPERVTVEIGVVGDLAGRVYYNLNMDSALFIASKFMMGMTVSDFDEMAQSAVSEMANMISGQTATVFYGGGVTIDISPPTLRVDADGSAFPDITAGAKVFCVPLSFSGGAVFEIDVLIS